MASSEVSQRPRRLMLVSVPRTASNLLAKILNIAQQPDVLSNEAAGYFFHPAFSATALGGYLSTPSTEWTDEQKQTLRSIFQGCVNTIEEHAERAEKANKILFAKEHAGSLFSPAAFEKWQTGDSKANDELFDALRLEFPEKFGPHTFSPSSQSMLSDEYLRLWQYVFIIRHPALAWPSLRRCQRKIVEAEITKGLDQTDEQKRDVSLSNMTMRWTRLLFDWFCDQGFKPTPLIVDANDLINHPEIAARLCEQTGMDANAVQYEWDNMEKRSEDWKTGNNVDDATHDRNIALAKIMLGTLENSTGVIKQKVSSDIDISKEAEQWRVEFGEEDAKFIEKAVRDSMPDYEYLMAHRITV
ncbi:hypothetical protein N7532_010499 [Penicillium argentinense]|uniref:Uncharacterized protein n=1 Tax=Penicillium argentinense TaxID=1131581 RepID=A0A9W9EPQ8_9EURO|nr:uncharacterized protein N7532_010499 [Penicillium argentinense]KAJ5085728.1 hypothetical protein N7532_010499 [Penicillium argentinense]